MLALGESLDYVVPPQSEPRSFAGTAIAALQS